MKKKYRFLYVILALLIILFILIIVLVINESKVVKYDEYKINQINKYLSINSMYYDGIQENLKISKYNVDFSSLDSIEVNKMIASYVITNLIPNKEYGYDNCKECYRYFSKNDNIRFYDVDDIENIYNELFDGNFKKITQEELLGFNILYYNKEIDKYYVNVVINSFRPEIISMFKGYSYNDNMLYLDYYYSNVNYEEDSNEKDNIDESSEKTYLYNMNDIMVKEIIYSDLFDDNNIPSNYDDYIEYFDVVRYVFKYDRKLKKYILKNMLLLEEF